MKARFTRKILNSVHEDSEAGEDEKLLVLESRRGGTGKNS
jgi:hypothetical protein